MFPRDIAHAGHDAHAQHDVSGIHQFQADLAQRRAGRPHQIRHDIHGSPSHAISSQIIKPFIHFFGRCPVIGWSRLFLGLGANESGLLHACDIVGMGTMIITARQFFLVELDKDSFLNRLGRERFLFRFRPVAPDHLIRLA